MAAMPFEPGKSGNPAGRPVGSRNCATLAMDALIDGEADAITRKCIELAKEGDGPPCGFVWNGSGRHAKSVP